MGGACSSQMEALRVGAGSILSSASGEDETPCVETPQSRASVISDPPLGRGGHLLFLCLT